MTDFEWFQNGMPTLDAAMYLLQFLFSWALFIGMCLIIVCVPILIVTGLLVFYLEWRDLYASRD